MAYAYDVFVSYAHMDNAPLAKEDKGWVRTLVDKLKARADMEVRGKPVEIWMDPRLAGNRPFEDDILEGLDRSALVLIFMSKRYADSYWCQREQNTFLVKVKQRTNPTSSIFVVEKNKLDDDQKLPDEFLGLPRYQFWSEDNISKRVKTFGDPVPKEDEDEYWGELGRLAQELARELSQLRKTLEKEVSKSGDDTGPAQDGGPCVFLAEVTDDLRRKYHEVRSYLEQYGIRILPKAPYDRRDRDAYKVAVTNELRHCKLFVQLLSGLAGETAGDFRGYPFYQYEIAKPLNLPLFQWRQKDLNMDEADSDGQIELLNLPSVRAEPIDDFKKAVLEAAKAKAAPPQPPRTGVVFVNTDACDWSLAEDICQLLSNQGIVTYMPIQRDTPGLTAEQIAQDFEQSLQDCDGLIVVYGASTVPWVRGQFRLGTKVLAQRSPPVVAIYVAPPPHKADHGVRYPGMLPLDCRGNPHQPDAAALARFVAVLRGAPQ